MRLLALALIVGVAVESRASFDLMYLPDVGGNSVHRFDPVNRVYLGAINTPARHVSGHSSTSRLALSEAGSRLYFANGSTGEFEGEATTFAGTQGIMMRAGGLEAVTSSGAVLRRWGVPNGNIINSTSLGGTMSTGLSLAEIGSGRIALLGTTSGGLAIQTYGSTLNYVSESVVVTTSSVLSGASVSTLAYNTFAGISSLFFTYRSTDTTTSFTLARVTMTGGITVGTVATLNLVGFSTASPTSTPVVVAGHNGSFFVVGPSTVTTSTRIQHFSSNLIKLQDYTTSAFAVPTGGYWTGTNLVAPEPGSMIALGLGVAALLKRRAKRQ